jgi:predicted phage terminase large subunit-like protein
MAVQIGTREDHGVITIEAQPGPQRLFLEMSHVDFILYGGSRGGGKSYALLIEALRHVSYWGYGAVIFRRTYPQIMQTGGLWDTSEEIYSFAGAKPTKGSLIWKWANGSTVAFRSMQNEDDKNDWLGASIPFIAFDEINTFTMTQVFALFACNRSGRCDMKPYARGTCNPDPDSWVANFISWWWDQKTGYAIPERSGKVRWFVRINDVIEWADTADELKAQHPGCYPKSFTFIASSVDDNKILMRKDPGYRANLEALPLVDRERYLKGNWKIRVGARNILRREWFEVIDRSQLLQNLKLCRYWDVAATVPNKDNKDPDWTSGSLVGLLNGVWYIIDIDRFRGTPKTVEERIRSNAENDGIAVKVRLEEEGGASGPSMTDYYARTVLVGFSFAGVKSLKNKVTRAGPLAAAAEKGNVKIVRAPWNEAFLAECDNFKGEDEKNDTIDSTTGAINELRQGGGVWKIAVPTPTGKYDPTSTMPVTGRYTPLGA